MSPVARRWSAVLMCLLAFAGRLATDLWAHPLALRTEATVPSMLIGLAALVVTIGVPLTLYVAVVSPRSYPAVLEVDAARARFIAPAGHAWEIQAILLAWIGGGVGPTLADGEVDGEFLLSVAALVATGVAAAFLVFGNRPRLVLDPAGLTVVHLTGRRRVRWDDLLPGGPHPPAARGLTDKITLLLRPREPGAAPARVKVPAGQLGVSPKFLAATIRHYAEQPQLRSAIGTETELARLRSTLAATR